MSTAALTSESKIDRRSIDRRYDFVLLFDVALGNPNGDPDAGNAPRMDPETGHGLVSDVSLKRKVRNFILLAKTDPIINAPEPGYDIYVKERAILNNQHQLAYNALGLDPSRRPGKGEESNEERARRWMCQTFFDVRMFGAVMTTGVNAGQVRGPVQLTFARSIDPITSLEQSITRKAVTTGQDAEDQIKKHGMITGTMGRKEIIPYGLYRVHGFVSPQLAAQTGFSMGDLDLLWLALERMFEFDRSATRGEMATRRLYIFEHESPLGNAPAHRLFEKIQVRCRNPEIPPRGFADYEVTVAGELPAGITLHERG